MKIASMTRTLLSLAAGTVVGIALVISCQMGPPGSMAQSTTGGSSGGGTTGGSSGGTGGSGTTGGGSGGCGPCTVTGLVKTVNASEDSGQLVVLTLPPVPRTATVPSNVINCTVAVQGFPELYTTSKGAVHYCVRVAAGPFVLTDLVQGQQFQTVLQTALFVAPDDASLNQAGFGARWAYLPISNGAANTAEFHDTRFTAVAGENLYAYVGTYNLAITGEYAQPSRFTWSGFHPYQ